LKPERESLARPQKKGIICFLVWNFHHFFIKKNSLASCNMNKGFCFGEQIDLISPVFEKNNCQIGCEFHSKKLATQFHHTIHTVASL
jgi:hypothetical protein